MRNEINQFYEKIILYKNKFREIDLKFVSRDFWAGIKTNILAHCVL